MVGTSNESVPDMAVDHWVHPWFSETRFSPFNQSVDLSSESISHLMDKPIEKQWKDSLVDGCKILHQLIAVFIVFQPPKVVQDFFHPQYLMAQSYKPTVYYLVIEHSNGK